MTAVHQLGPDSTGRWLVTTQRSTHVWDLDAGTYMRQPGDGSERFGLEGQPMKITRVERWPAVGDRSIVWFDDPEFPNVMEHYRVSSAIRSIEQLDS